MTTSLVRLIENLSMLVRKLRVFLFLAAAFLVSVAITGCGRDDMSLNPSSAKFLQLPIKPHQLIVDKGLDGLLREFLDLASYYGLDTSVTIGQLREVKFAQGLLDGLLPSVAGGGTSSEAGSLMGVCERGELNNVINKKVNSDILFVYLDSSFASQTTTALFKVLTFHELAHCLLNAVHTAVETTPLVSAEFRLISLLDTTGVHGIASTDGRTDDLTLFRALYYPSKVFSSLKAKADASYDADNMSRHHIMSAYFDTEDTFWDLNMYAMVDDLFTSLGGKKPGT